MKLLLLAVSMIMVVTINCRGHWKPLKVQPPIELQHANETKRVGSTKTSRDNGLGPPISIEEIAAAIANPNLMKPHPGEDHAEENSGEFEGDIVLTPEQQVQLENGVRSATTLYQKWENGIIPYTISDVYTIAERQIIARAIAEYEANTCIKIIGRTTEPDYIEIYKGSWCSSNIGRVGGKQRLSLSSGCFSQVGTTIHEFMHAAGFWHEQSRSDRDDYVNIHLENVRSGREHNFNKQTTSTTTDLGLEYDYSSVMHYSANAFSKNGQPTIIPKKAGVTIGNRDGFSKLDLQGLNMLYKCGVCSGVRIGDQCMTFSSESLSWNDAKEKCESENGKLASLNDLQAFRDHVASHYRHSYFWLGGSDIRKEGNWVWENGKPLGAQFQWGQGEPNNHGSGEDCLEYIGRMGHPYYNDAPCHRRYRYVCENLQNDCVSPWFQLGNQCFLLRKEKSEQRNWASARTYCGDQISGADLAQPNDLKALDDYLKDNGHSSGWYFLGGSDLVTEGDWRWNKGNGAITTGWAKSGNNPDGRPGDDCLVMWSGWGANSMADYLCYVAGSFICERH